MSNVEMCKEALNGLVKETHHKNVLKYILNNGSITSFESFEKLKNTRLSASIYVLRYTYNLPIGMEMCTSENGKRYGRYYIEKGETNDNR